MCSVRTNWQQNTLFCVSLLLRWQSLLYNTTICFYNWGKYSHKEITAQRAVESSSTNTGITSPQKNKNAKNALRHRQQLLTVCRSQPPSDSIWFSAGSGSSGSQRWAVDSFIVFIQYRSFTVMQRSTQGKLISCARLQQSWKDLW